MALEFLGLTMLPLGAGPVETIFVPDSARLLRGDSTVCTHR